MTFGRLLHNEREVRQPLCGQRVYCPVKMFLSILERVRGDMEDYVRECGLDVEQARAFRNRGPSCTSKLARF
jgi:hypothetical protein